MQEPADLRLVLVREVKQKHHVPALGGQRGQRLPQGGVVDLDGDAQQIEAHTDIIAQVVCILRGQLRGLTVGQRGKRDLHLRQRRLGVVDVNGDVFDDTLAEGIEGLLVVEAIFF